MAGDNRTELKSSTGRVRLSAVENSASVLDIPLPGRRDGETVALSLSRLAGFATGAALRTAEFTVENGKVRVIVFAPARPGNCVLSGPGIRVRLDFAAATHQQALVYEWAPTLGIAVVIALILRSFVVASFYIPSGSMENTLLKGDLLIADKFSYKLLGKEPRRGDVMIFQYPANRKQDFIKRLIGKPGDTVEVRDHVVHVNGVALEEPYVREAPWNDYGPKVVPPDMYFMMGDNRNHSSDSRVWGFVPRDYFEGRALFVFFPFTRAHSITNGLLAQSDMIPPGSAYAAEPGHDDAVVAPEAGEQAASRATDAAGDEPDVPVGSE